MENEKSNESIVSFAFVVAGALAWYLTAVLLEIFAGMFGAVARFRNLEAVRHGLPVAIGIAFGLYLFLNKRVYAWADESVAEVRKVVWPSRKDVTGMTIVVCAMCLLSGAAFGVFDFFASQLMKIFIK